MTPSYSDPQDARRFVQAAAGLAIGRPALLRVVEITEDSLIELLDSLPGHDMVVLARALRAELHRRFPDLW